MLSTVPCCQPCCHSGWPLIWSNRNFVEWHLNRRDTGPKTISSRITSFRPRESIIGIERNLSDEGCVAAHVLLTYSYSIDTQPDRHASS